MENRIVSDYRVMLGKPVVRGTRITVELLLRKMAQGASAQAILAMYPHLTNEDILAVLNYAADIVANQEPFEIVA